MYNVQCTMDNVQCTMDNAQCTMCNGQCTIGCALQFKIIRKLINSSQLSFHRFCCINLHNAQLIVNYEL